MSRLAACIITFLVTGITVGAAMLFTSFSFPGKSKPRTYSVAAIAVRDDVVQYQKTATKLFTRRYLNKLYDDYIYLEEKNIEHQQQKFVEGLRRMIATHDSVDIYLLAHGNDMVKWMYAIDSNSRKKIRLVYNCGCTNAHQYHEWGQLGIKYYLAHSGAKSLSPIFFYFFIRKRADGRTLEKSIKAANWHTRLVLKTIGFSKSKANESCATLFSF